MVPMLYPYPTASASIAVLTDVQPAVALVLLTVGVTNVPLIHSDVLPERYSVPEQLLMVPELLLQRHEQSLMSVPVLITVQGLR